MNLSAFGRFIRKYRIDHEILLKEMADKLGFSSAFMSAIETGAKNLPGDLEQKLLNSYEFTSEEKNHLQEAIDLSRTQINLVFSDSPIEQRIVGAFCRNFGSLDDERKKEILKLLKGNTNE